MLFIYKPGESFFHKTDAVTKLLWLIIVTAIVLLLTTFTENLIMFVYLLLTALLLAKQNFWHFIKRLLPITVVGLWLLLIMSIFYTRGETYWFSIGPISITKEGADFGGALFFRLFSLGSASFIFSLTTEPQRMVAELVEYGHLPYRIAYTFYAGLRFMPLLQSEADNVLNAHAVRGAAEKEHSFLNVIAPIKRLATPLLVTGLRRVRITAIAMDSRGFGAYPTRTNILNLSRNTLSIVYLILHILIFLILFTWRVILGHGETLIAPIVK